MFLFFQKQARIRHYVMYFVNKAIGVIIEYMEWPRLREQIESLWPKLWPRKMSTEELQEELNRANDGLMRTGKRKGEDQAMASGEKDDKSV